MSLVTMNTDADCLAAFAGITFLHVPVFVLERVFLTVSGKAQINQFQKSRNADESTLFGRIQASHQNCLENLLPFAAVVLANTMKKGADFGSMAKWMVVARLGQVLAHLAGRDAPHVSIRATFFFAQVGILGAMFSKVLFCRK
eukprot:GDKH01019811.1.p2 GENE.GDKH01019811.1~~GDKH01019811.1.p2  ORF type:complete len:156 (+),score=21.80 GDKH01019811.1:40-468(+)